MKKTFTLLLSLLFLHSFATPTFAMSEPPLFSCQSPVGNTIADFNDGTHGIAGSSATYTGSDHVYSIDSDHVVQCFCPSDSNDGIQSNWAKLSDTSDETINYYEKLGWTYVPNGLAWGLDDSAYIVKNEAYSCNSSSNPDPTSSNGSGSSSGSSSSSGSGSSSSDSSSGSSSNSPSSDSTQGQILGASTLAYTGNDRTILLYGLLGIAFAFIAYKLAQE